MSGSQLVESALHKAMVEHLNAEIVLGTVMDISLATEWLRSTFLYVRALQHPQFYFTTSKGSKEQVENHLHGK